MADRQLNNLSYHHLRVDSQRLLSSGYTWGYEIEPALLSGDGASKTIAFVTGDSPVVLDSYGIRVAGDETNLLDITFYGGTEGLDEGGAIMGLPVNHHVWQPEPMAQVLDTPTWTATGEVVARDFLIGSGDISGGQSLIMAPNLAYLLSIKRIGAPAPSFSGNWVYLEGNATPAQGEAIYRWQSDRLRFNFLDDDGGNRETELNTVVGGWYATSETGGNFTITAAVSAADYREFTAIGSADPGRSLWTFSGPSTPANDALLSMYFRFAALPPANLL